jgi:hypothetical protein
MGLPGDLAKALREELTGYKLLTRGIGLVTVGPGETKSLIDFFDKTAYDGSPDQAYTRSGGYFSEFWVTAEYPQLWILVFVDNVPRFKFCFSELMGMFNMNAVDAPWGSIRVRFKRFGYGEDIGLYTMHVQFNRPILMTKSFSGLKAENPLSVPVKVYRTEAWAFTYDWIAPEGTPL